MSKHAFQPLDARTLRQGVTEAIRQVILAGELLPGDQVNQAQIAEQLGVSRGPVREALGQLEEEGLIRNIPYKGTFVTAITADYISELYSIRRVLETFAVRLAAEHATLEDLDELRTVIRQMHAAAEADDMARMSTLDIEFHSLLCRSSHHVLLMQIWKSIEIGVRRCLALRHRIYRSPYDVIGTHPHILAALEAHDAERASSILDTHIAEAGDLLYRSWAAAAEAKAAEAKVAEPAGAGEASGVPHGSTP